MIKLGNWMTIWKPISRAATDYEMQLNVYWHYIQIWRRRKLRWTRSLFMLLISINLHLISNSLSFCRFSPLGTKAICWEMDYVKIGLRPDWIKLKYVWAIVISYWGKSLQRYLASTNNLFLSSIMFNQIAHPFWKVNFYNYQIDLTDITKKLVKIYEYLE